MQSAMMRHGLAEIQSRVFRALGALASRLWHCHLNLTGSIFSKR